MIKARIFTGSEIKAIREGMAMSQTDFGKQFGPFRPVDQTTVWRWEANLHRPRPRHRLRLEELWLVVERKKRRIPRAEDTRKKGLPVILNISYT